MQYSGSGVGQKWSISDMRRSKDTPSKNKPKFLAEKIFNGER